MYAELDLRQCFCCRCTVGSEESEDKSLILVKCEECGFQYVISLAARRILAPDGITQAEICDLLRALPHDSKMLLIDGKNGRTNITQIEKSDWEQLKKRGDNP